MELKEYAYAEVDVDFVRKCVRAIGRCALKIESSAERCVAVLVDLIQVQAALACPSLACPAMSRLAPCLASASVSASFSAARLPLRLACLLSSVCECTRDDQGPALLISADQGGLRCARGDCCDQGRVPKVPQQVRVRHRNSLREPRVPRGARGRARTTHIARVSMPARCYTL